MTSQALRRGDVLFDSLTNILADGGAESVASALTIHVVAGYSHTSPWLTELVEALSGPFVVLRDSGEVPLELESFAERLAFERLHDLAFHGHERFPALTAVDLAKLRNIFERLSFYEAGAIAQDDFTLEEYDYRVGFFTAAIWSACRPFGAP